MHRKEVSEQPNLNLLENFLFEHVLTKWLEKHQVKMHIQFWIFAVAPWGRGAKIHLVDYEIGGVFGPQKIPN